MTKQQKKILIIALIVFLLGLLLLLFYFFLIQKVRKPAVTNENANVSVTLPYNPPVTNANVGFKTPAKVFTTPDDNEIQVKVLAQNFSERFGSYSNQSNLTDYLNDLTMMTTASMENYLNNFVNSLNLENSGLYHGITTKVLKVIINNLETQSAETLVTTQRTETNESQNIINRVYYQDLKLKLIKDNNQWLVDGAWWQ